MQYRKNGNGATGVPAIKGAGIANRYASKRQRAALAASILEGETGFVPSKAQLARLFGVSVSYISVAQAFTPAKRRAVADGNSWISFTDLLSSPKMLALPAPKPVTDEALEEIVRHAGIARTLDAAIAVESHATA